MEKEKSRKFSIGLKTFRFLNCKYMYLKGKYFELTYCVDFFYFVKCLKKVTFAKKIVI